MSRPTQIRIMLVLAFVLTLAAGIVIGAGFARRSLAGDAPHQVQDPVPPPTTKESTTRPTRGGGSDWFPDRLGLSGEQRTKWMAIWRESPHEKFREIGSRERACYQNRDDAIKALYTSEQREQKDRIYDDYRGKIGELFRERDKAISSLYTKEQKAEKERLERECIAKVAALKAERDRLMQPLLDRSRQILTEDQRKRFDTMLRPPSLGPGHRGGPPGGASPGGPGRRGPGGASPSTRPSTSPPNPTQSPAELGSAR